MTDIPATVTLAFWECGHIEVDRGKDHPCDGRPVCTATTRTAAVAAPNRSVAVFTGSRDWRDWDTVEADVALLPRHCVVVHGGQRGLDVIAGSLARKHGLHVSAVNWRTDLYGKAAGPKRNQALAALLPTVCFAYPLPTSVGTWDMVRRAEAVGAKTIVRSNNDEARPKPKFGDPDLAKEREREREAARSPQGEDHEKTNDERRP